VETVGLLLENLRNPIVLAFELGAVAWFVKSDLEIAPPVSSVLSIYLLLAMGLRGGKEPFHIPFDQIAAPVAATLVLGPVTPLTAYWAARRRYSGTDAAAFAVHYGSVSAVTFTATQAGPRERGGRSAPAPLFSFCSAQLAAVVSVPPRVVSTPPPPKVVSVPPSSSPPPLQAVRANVSIMPRARSFLFMSTPWYRDPPPGGLPRW
jgi:hypothetical protein